MKILQVNKFFFLRGGSERYMIELSKILKAKGHEIAYFSMHHEMNVPSEWSDYFVKNIDYDKCSGVINLFKSGKNILYSREAERNMTRLIEDFKPDVAHIHNFNHQLTPSILFALKRKKIPVVMTLHDYKLACPSYNLLNHGKPCGLCAGKKFYHSLMTKCHKNSLAKSLLVTLESYLHHHILKSYRNIKSFICPSKFMVDKMRSMGFEGNLVHVPHFAPDYAKNPERKEENNAVVYCGRLSREKGIMTLIDAVNDLPVNLTIIGEGPLRKTIEDRSRSREAGKTILMGHLDGQKVAEEIRGKGILIIPSEWYEVFGLVILEAFASGVPVIGSRIGAIPEIITEGKTGMLFEPHNSSDLRNKILYLLSGGGIISEMGKNAKSIAQKEYSPEAHYKRVIEEYNKAIGK